MIVLIVKLVAVVTIGAILLFVLSFTVYRQSFFYKKVQAEMNGVTRKPGLLSRVVTIGILLSMVLFLVLADLWIAPNILISVMVIFALNLLLIGLLSIFDALFIDYFLLLVWRPAFWRLPEGEPKRDRMTHHIKLQFTVGWLFKVPIALVATGISIIIRNGL